MKCLTSKQGRVDFTFIARYPSAIFAAGGILCILIGKNEWAIILIAVSVLLHVLWLRR